MLVIWRRFICRWRNSLLIVADHDTPRPIGFQAAHDLATRALKQGLKVQIWQPETQGFDGLDELNRIKKESTIMNDFTPSD